MSLVVDTGAQAWKETDLRLDKMKCLPHLSSATEVSAGMRRSTLSGPAGGGGVFRIFSPLQPCLAPCKKQRSHLDSLML